jgi:hypothetical protein
VLPLILYTPLAVALGVLLAYSARGAARGYGGGRLVPLTLLLAAALGGSLYLMFGVGRPWVAVAVVAAATAPLLAPVALLATAVLIGKLTGRPVRWN